MGPTRLSKFMHNNSDSEGQPIHWNRAADDGAPFRGEPRLLTEEEYRKTTVKVVDAHNGIFDLEIPEQNKEYIEICDKVYNNAASFTYIERMITVEHRKVYVEWVEYYMQHTPTSSG